MADEGAFGGVERGRRSATQHKEEKGGKEKGPIPAIRTEMGKLIGGKERGLHPECIALTLWRGH